MMRTVEDLLGAGLVLRWWCFSCAAGAELEREELAGDWHLELAEIAICCPKCWRIEDVIALPTAAPPEPLPEPEPDWPMTGENIVAFIFHASRSAAKKRRRGW